MSRIDTDLIIQGVGGVVGLLSAQEDADERWAAFEEALEDAEDSVPLAGLVRRFQLEAFDVKCLLLALAPHVEPRMPEVVAEATRQAFARAATVRVALEHFCSDPSERVTAQRQLRRWRLHEQRAGILRLRLGLRDRADRRPADHLLRAGHRLAIGEFRPHHGRGRRDDGRRQLGRSAGHHHDLGRLRERQRGRHEGRFRPADRQPDHLGRGRAGLPGPGHPAGRLSASPPRFDSARLYWAPLVMRQTPMLLVITLAACQTPPAPVHPPDVGADEPDVATAPVTGPRAYVITADHPDDLASGDMAGARIGDLVIANDLVRFVVRTGPHALYLTGLGGGMIVDAGAPAQDRVQEVIPIVGFSSFGESQHEIVRDGRDGVAEIRISGIAATPPILAGVLPGIGVEGALTQTYRLGIGEHALEMTIELEGATEAQLVGDMMLFGGDLEPLINETGGWLATEGEGASLGLVAPEPVAVADFGGIQAVLGPTLEPPIRWTRWLVVGDGSMSSVVDRILELRMAPRGTVAGRVDDPEARVTARDSDGDLVTRFRPNADGSFAGALPAGLITLVAEGPGRPPGAPVTVDVVDGSDVADLQLVAQPRSTLVVQVDRPTRITLLPISGGRIVLPVPAGSTTLPVAPGEYSATATRGFEWEADSILITLGAGEQESWAPSLERVVDTTGWIAADFHLHSEWSADSNVPLRDRVVACAAEGIEYAVATDHDVVTSYAPFVPDSVAPFIRVAAGIEVSTGDLGHWNVWPLELDPDRPGRGAFAWAGLEFDALLDALGPEVPGRVVQLNHARGLSGMATFDEIGFDPLALDGGAADMRFTALELVNGVAGTFDELLIDWLALVQAGRSIAATGVSDAHSISSYCGHGRTMVRVDSDDPATLDPLDVDAAVLAMGTMVTSGPFVTLEQAAGGGLHLRIQAPSYVPVSTVTLYADGVPDTTVDVPPFSEDPMRLDQDVEVSNAGAAWFVAVVTTDQPPPSPMLREDVRAVSAPLFVQAP